MRRRSPAAIWERGSGAEGATAAALSDLPADTWAVISDVRWPGRRPATIDYIAVGPGGVFVIDSKKWVGTITVTGGTLRLNKRARHRQLASVEKAADAIVDLLPQLQPGRVRPVLCVERDEYVAERFGKVLVWSSHNLGAMLKSRTEVLNLDQQIEVVRQFEATLPSSRSLLHRVLAPRQAASAASETAPETTRRKTRSRKAVTVMGLASLAVVAALIVRPAALDDVVDDVSDRVSNAVTDLRDMFLPPEETDQDQKKNMQQDNRKQQRENRQNG